MSFYLAFVNIELEGPILIPNDGQLFSFLPNNGSPCKAYHHVSSAAIYFGMHLQYACVAEWTQI